MATIRKRGDSYRISVYVGLNPEGKEIKKYINYVPTEKAKSKIRKEVLAAAVDFERRVKEGKILDGEHLSFAEFAEFWLENHAKKTVSVTQYEQYVQMITKRINPAIGHLKMSKIRPLHLMDLYAEMEKAGRSANTIRKYHACIRNVFNAAYKWDVVADNPCHKVSLAPMKEKYKYQIWDPKQVNIFLNALEDTYTLHYNERVRADGSGNEYVVAAYNTERDISAMFIALFYLLIYSSCRRGEACALTWEDIDFKKKEISISKAASKTKEGQLIKAPKTQSGIRRISLPEIVFAKLRSWRIAEMQLMLNLGSQWEGYRRDQFDKNYVFIQQINGKMINIDTISKKFGEIVELHNSQCDEKDVLPVIRLHDLRHTGASLMIANNIDVVTVSHRLGHAKPSTTMDIYSHALPLKDKAASEALYDIILQKSV